MVYDCFDCRTHGKNFYDADLSISPIVSTKDLKISRNIHLSTRD